MADDVRKSRLQWVRKELEQVAVAMSLVGTRRQKLIEMARLVTPAFNALVGNRPEIKKVRDEMRRGLHNLRRSQTTPKAASKNMRAVAATMGSVIKLSDKGLLDLDEEYEVGPFVLENVWGYTEREVRQFISTMREMMVGLDAIGLYDKLAYGDIQLDPEKTQSYLSYDRRGDFFVANIDKARSDEEIFKAMGERLWDKGFKTKERDVWGGPSHRSKFVQAFSIAMKGNKQDRDTMARLTLTVG